jgi:hypothetical protein
MDTVTQFPGLRTAGFLLLATVIVFMIGAWAAVYFRQWPFPPDALGKLQIIASDPVGWPAQAILLPAAMAVTAVVFAGLTGLLPAPWSRWLALVATVLMAVGFLLWLPISAYRLQLGANAAEMIRTYDPSAPPVVMATSPWLFWSHTFCVLGAIGLMGVALALAGALPLLGWIVAGLAVTGALTGLFIMHDWPPFMSYVIALVLAVGLINTG